MADSGCKLTLAGPGTRERRSAYLIPLGLFFIFGCALGVFEGDRLFRYSSVSPIPPVLSAVFLRGIYPVVLAVFFSTSTVGWSLIPVVFLAKGFSVSAGFAYLVQFGSKEIFYLGAAAAADALSLAVLFYIGQTAMARAFDVRHVCAGLPPGEETGGGTLTLAAAVLLQLVIAYIKTKLISAAI